MKRNKKLLLLSGLLVWLHGMPGYAGELDIFGSHRPIPIEAVYLPQRLPNLEALPEKEIAKVLQEYLKMAGKLRDREKRNLHNLAIGYLYLMHGDYKKAVNFLQNNIIGNFILDDFKINFQASALKELALKELEKKKFARAIEFLRKSIQLRLRIYSSSPDSQFYTSLPQALAETEKSLGDAYFQTFNYKAAWQAYRKALMRTFPGDEEHRLQVYLSLAKTYESAGNLQEAMDILVHLSNKNFEPEIKEVAETFLKNHEKRIREEKLDPQILSAALSEKDRDKPGKSQFRSSKTNVSFKRDETDQIQKLYKLLTQKNYDKTFKQAYLVLSEFPGTEFSRNIINNVNRMIVKYLKDHSWNTGIGKITELYPAQTLRELAYDLWRNFNPDAAAILYNKILSKYPLEKESCHKALFFIGRIYEDKKEYDKALQFYDGLVKRYDFGPYTTAALFKIPWIERLLGHQETAVKLFKDNIDFYGSVFHERLLASFPKSPSFLAASRYWMAQTAESMKNLEEKKFQLEKLVEESPFDFYGVIARGELGMPLKDFFGKETEQPLAERRVGLGETQHKYLKRAEKLIAAGFMGWGIQELTRVVDNSEDRPFMFYLSRLFYLAGEYHKSIKFSWKVIDQENIRFVSSELSKNLFPTAYLQEVESLAKKSRVDSMLVLSLIRQESAFDPRIVSSANAVGLMQLLPATAKQVAGWRKMSAPNFEGLKSPKINLPLGIAYLRRLLSSFDNKTYLALAAYNAGPQKVDEWVSLRSEFSPLEFMESIPYNETRGYVKKVLRNYYIYLALYKDREIRDVKEILTTVGE